PQQLREAGASGRIFLSALLVHAATCRRASCAHKMQRLSIGLSVVVWVAACGNSGSTYGEPHTDGAGKGNVSSGGTGGSGGVDAGGRSAVGGSAGTLPATGGASATGGVSSGGTAGHGASAGRAAMGGSA